MKRQILLVIAFFSFVCVYAQTDHVITDPNYRLRSRKRARCPKLLIDLSTGVNNNGGILGLGLDCHVVQDISINAGVGVLSTWGIKYYGGFKYYAYPCHIGWAFGGGISHSRGYSEFRRGLQTTAGGNEIVTLKCLPQTNMFVSAYRHWYVGRNKNRLYLQLGWSIPFTKDKFEQISGTTITKDATKKVRSLTPGGLIVGMGIGIGT